MYLSVPVCIEDSGWEGTRMRWRCWESEDKWLGEVLNIISGKKIDKYKRKEYGRVQEGCGVSLF